MVVYSPQPVVRLIDSLLDLLENRAGRLPCQDRLKEALAAHEAAEQRQRFLACCWEPGDPLAAVCAEVGGLLARRRQLYLRVEQCLVHDIDSLTEILPPMQELSAALAQKSQQLERERRLRPAWSEFRPLDELLRIAQNGALSFSQKRSLIAPYADEVLLWLQHREREACLFLFAFKVGEDEWQRVLSAVETGLEKIALALDEGSAEALLQGTEFLQEGARHHQGFKQAMQVSRQAETGLADPLWSAFLMVCKGASEGGRGVTEVHRCLALIKRWVEVQQAEGERTLRQGFFHPEQRKLWTRRLSVMLAEIGQALPRVEAITDLPKVLAAGVQLYRAAEQFETERKDWLAGGDGWKRFSADSVLNELFEAVTGWALEVVARPNVLTLLERAYLGAYFHHLRFPDLELPNFMLKSLLALKEAVSSGRRDDLEGILLQWQDLVTDWDRLGASPDLGSAEKAWPQLKTYLLESQKRAHQALEEMERLEDAGEIEGAESLYEGLDELDLAIQHILEDEQAASSMADNAKRLQQIAALLKKMSGA